jgi:hypothetical protein
LGISGGQLYGKLAVNSGSIDKPQMSAFGGYGDRYISYLGSTLDYPCSVGIGTNCYWNSASSNFYYSWFIGGNEKMNMNTSNLYFTGGNINASNLQEGGISLYNKYMNSNFYFSNVNPYSSKKYYIQLPNTNFWYDSINSVYCYDLNIEKYASSLNLGGGYKARAFRISTLVPDCDWIGGWNLYFNNKYINYPEPLTIYMNNNSNVSGTSYPNDNYANGIILGKTQNTNIGYWKLLSTSLNSYNYIRYISKVGWNTNVVVENLLTY